MLRVKYGASSLRQELRKFLESVDQGYGVGGWVPLLETFSCRGSGVTRASDPPVPWRP